MLDDRLIIDWGRGIVLSMNTNTTNIYSVCPRGPKQTYGESKTITRTGMIVIYIGTFASLRQNFKVEMPNDRIHSKTAV